MTKLEATIINLPPVRSVIERSKSVTIPGFQQLPLYDVAKFFVSQVKKVGLSLRASSIAFYFLMAIPAGMIFLCTLIPYMPVSHQIAQELLVLAADFTPNATTFLLVEAFLKDFLTTERSGLLSLGFLLAVYYSSNAMMGIMRTFNKSMIDSPKRNFLESRWIAIQLTSLVIMMVIVCLILLIMQGRFLHWLNIKDPRTAALISTLRWIVITTFIFYMIAFIYKYAPAVEKRWKLSSPGTILATVLMIATTFLFSFWVNTFNSFNKIYGSIGTVLIIMLLTYINSLILLIGFELNVSIHSLKILSERREKKALDL
jgi:membrane protein